MHIHTDSTYIQGKLRQKQHTYILYIKGTTRVKTMQILTYILYIKETIQVKAA